MNGGCDLPLIFVSESWSLCFFLLTTSYSKILLQLCQLYSTGHFIAELTLYQTLESGKDTSLHRPGDSGYVS